MVETPRDSSSEVTNTSLQSKLLLQHMSIPTINWELLRERGFYIGSTIQFGLANGNISIILPLYCILALQVFLIHSLVVVGTLALHHSPVESASLGGEKGFTTHLPGHLLTLIGACLFSKFKSM